MLYLALQALKANRLKTTLTFVSLFFSISSIFLVTSLSNGVISMYSNMLQSDGDIIITQANISDTFFSDVDTTLVPKIEKLNGVKKVSAIIVGASPIETLPIVAVYGVSKNRFANYYLKDGTYPKSSEVLLGESIFENFKNEKYLHIAGKKFKISGVYRSDIGFENGGVLLNLEDAGAIFHKKASMLMVNSTINTDIWNIKKQIQNLSTAIQVKSTQNFIDNYNQFKIIKTSSNLIASISFILGLLSVVSIMSIIIHQRKSEFGIKKAIGISSKQIIFQIILESAILGVVSFFASFVFSFFLLHVIKSSAFFHGYINGEITLELAFYIFLFSSFMTILGSILPALNAAKVDPMILIQGERI